jgi:dUTP pyrophosphatase
MPLKVKKLNPLATIPTIANVGEDLGYDVYALRMQGQPMYADGTPVKWVPSKPGMPVRLDNANKVVHPIRVEAARPLVIDTGIAVHYTRDDGKKYGLLVRPRSSLSKKGLVVLGGEIDSGYRGEVKIILCLTSGSFLDLWPGDKIAQLRPVEVLADTVEEVETLEESARGDKGFGSSDKQS